MATSTSATWAATGSSTAGEATADGANLQDSGASRSLDDDWASRFNGSERMSAFRSNFGEMGGRFGGFRRR